MAHNSVIFVSCDFVTEAGFLKFFMLFVKIHGFAYGMRAQPAMPSDSKIFFRNRKNRMYGYHICNNVGIREGISVVDAIASSGSGAQ